MSKFDKHLVKGPTRLQKRWSGRLRTFGALVALLGGVALFDRFLGLARNTGNDFTPVTPGSAPLPIGAATLVFGLLTYFLGRRWSRRPPSAQQDNDDFDE